MPITIVVRSAAGEAPSLTFDGARIVLGRSDGSDVRLPDPSVSLRHASIRAQGAEYALVDEGSTNGTWVGGVKLAPQTPRLLKTGDLVRIGRVWVEVLVGQRAPTPDLGLATKDLALALVRQAMAAAGDDTLAKVRVVEGPDMGLELALAEDGRVYVVGRAEACDLPLADEDASREHAAILRRGATVFVRDLGSRNGVFLGEAAVANRDVPWRAPTMVRIGQSVLALEEPVSQALAELEALPDERLPETGAPPAPPSLLVKSVATPAEAAPEPLPESRRVEPAADGPIAQVDERKLATVVKRKKRGWTMADIAVVSIAVVVISVSLAGLVWVLR